MRTARRDGGIGASHFMQKLWDCIFRIMSYPHAENRFVRMVLAKRKATSVHRPPVFASSSHPQEDHTHPSSSAQNNRFQVKFEHEPLVYASLQRKGGKIPQHSGIRSEETTHFEDTHVRTSKHPMPTIKRSTGRSEELCWPVRQHYAPMHNPHERATFCPPDESML